MSNPDRRDASRIQPWPPNPAYWQYQGKPVLLLGGSVEDNLFQLVDLKAHLDLLQAVGGNYVRNTMSSRDDGNVWPHALDASGHYDLTRFDDTYWDRFRDLLELTAERDIIVQIEVWDRFDFAREPWQANPFNPKNNGNYSAETSTLPERITTHPGENENPFFFSVPEERDNRLLLPYQQAFVDTLLAYSLLYDHVLYCMDNETNGSPAWGAYWARYIRDRAEAAGTRVETTEMWDAWDLAHPMHAHTLEHPELYTFVDISQNNHQQGQTHWDNAQALRQRVSAPGRVRPINSVKVYGANSWQFGSDRDGCERFWRNLFGGLASARFHRPPAGLGLSETAQAHLKSARMMTDAFNVFAAEPRNDLLVARQDNSAYLLAQPGVAWTVFFPDGGEASLELPAQAGELKLQWLEIARSTWREASLVRPSGPLLRLVPPGPGYWALLITPS